MYHVATSFITAIVINEQSVKCGLDWVLWVDRILGVKCGLDWIGFLDDWNELFFPLVLIIWYESISQSNSPVQSTFYTCLIKGSSFMKKNFYDLSNMSSDILAIIDNGIKL